MPHHAICIDNKKDYYTNGDRLTGHVVLNLHKDLVTKAVDVKLCCRELAIVVYTTSNGTTSSTQRDIRKRKVVTEKSRIIGDSDADQMHILPEGSRVFPFEFQIPMFPDAQLSSFQGFLGGGVTWYIKLVIRRSAFKSNIRVVEPFALRRYQPIEPVASSLGPILTSEKEYRSHLPGYNGFNLIGRIRGDKKQPVNLRLQAQVPTPYFFLETANPLAISLSCSRPELVAVLGVEVKIKEHAYVCANSHSALHTRYHPIYKGSTDHVSPMDAINDLNHHLIEARIPESVPANFFTRLHEVFAELIVKVKITSVHAKRHKTELEIRTQIDIWDGVPRGKLPDYVSSNEKAGYSEKEALVWDSKA